MCRKSSITVNYCVTLHYGGRGGWGGVCIMGVGGVLYYLGQDGWGGMGPYRGQGGWGEALCYCCINWVRWGLCYWGTVLLGDSVGEMGPCIIGDRGGTLCYWGHGGWDGALYYWGRGLGHLLLGTGWVRHALYYCCIIGGRVGGTYIIGDEGGALY